MSRSRQQSHFTIRSFKTYEGSLASLENVEFEDITAFDFPDMSDATMLDAMEWLGEVERIVHDDIDAV